MAWLDASTNPSPYPPPQKVYPRQILLGHHACFFIGFRRVSSSIPHIAHCILSSPVGECGECSLRCCSFHIVCILVVKVEFVNKFPKGSCLKRSTGAGEVEDEGRRPCVEIARLACKARNIGSFISPIYCKVREHFRLTEHRPHLRRS